MIFTHNTTYVRFYLNAYIDWENYDIAFAAAANTAPYEEQPRDACSWFGLPLGSRYEDRSATGETPMSAKFEIVTGDSSDAGSIKDNLLLSLQSKNPQATNTSFCYSAKHKNGELAGGVNASTAYGWLLINSIWVSENVRGCGLGRKLIEHAEEKARRLGCHAAWLDTSDSDARNFYEHLGYSVFAKIKNDAGHVPPQHCRWFLKRAL